MRAVISYVSNRCKKCINCVKACPVNAISIVNEEVTIDNDKCINCGICIQACEEKVLKIKNVNIEKALKKHEYNIVMIPSAILSDIKKFSEIKNIAAALKKYGFDEVVQYSDIEGFLYELALKEYKDTDEVKITSFCPTINRLIRNEYPSLLENLLPYDYPAEIKARELRRKYEGKDIGIFSLCECVSKLTLAQEPFHRSRSSIDYAISITSIFPQINKLKDKEEEDIEFNLSGVKSIVAHSAENEDLSVLSVSGYRQVKYVLDLIEFDQLKDVKILSLYPCYQGCIGGCYLWSNPFNGRKHMLDQLPECTGQITEVDYQERTRIREVEEDDIEEFNERMAWFNKVNAILETLPQYDCGSCGFANCRTLANKVASGEVDVSLCRIKRR